MPLGKAYNIITLLCNQDDLHPGGSKHYSRQIVPPRMTASSIFTKSELLM